jgi:hypothetical protein
VIEACEAHLAPIKPFKGRFSWDTNTIISFISQEIERHEREKPNYLLSEYHIRKFKEKDLPF